MIDRNWEVDQWEVSCDNCSETLVFDAESHSFGEVVAEIKSDGWRNKKVDGDWENWCDLCVN